MCLPVKDERMANATIAAIVAALMMQAAMAVERCLFIGWCILGWLFN